MIDIRDIVCLLRDNISELLTMGSLVIAAMVFKISARAHSESNRPYITVNLEKDDDPHSIYLIIRNNGIRGARDVQISFNPSLKSLAFSKCAEVKDISTCAYSYIAPQQVIKSFFDLTLDRFRIGPEYASKIEVDISYRGDNNNNKKKKRYKDSYLIDFGYMEYMIGPNESNVTSGFKLINKSLESIRKELRTLSERKHEQH